MTAVEQEKPCKMVKLLAGVRRFRQKQIDREDEMAQGRSSSNAVLILVLAILGICPYCALIGLGPIALILANNALKQIDSGLGDPSERGLMVVAKALGIIGAIVSGLMVFYICIVLGALIASQT